MIDISVIIPLFNSARWLPRLIQSLKNQQLNSQRFQVVFVDDGSTDDSRTVALKVLQGATFDWFYLTTPENRGYAGACNFGAVNSSGRYLLFLNADVWLEPQTLSEYLFAAEYHGDKCALSNVEVPYEGESWIACGNPTFDLSMSICTERKASPFEAEPNLWTVSPFWFIHRDVFFKVGMFDESLRMYGEEEDLAFRLHLRGYSVKLCPTAIIHHARAGDTETSISRRTAAFRNRCITVLKCAQGPLLLTLVPHCILFGLELVLVSLKTNPKQAACLLWDAVSGVFKAGRRIKWMRNINGMVRVNSDWKLIRQYLSLISFGRLNEVKAAFTKKINH